MSDVRVTSIEDTLDNESVADVSITSFDGLPAESGGGSVTSVNGHTGVVVLDAADVGAATTAQGALADSATQPGDLATVATTGDYDDLTNKPTLGSAAAADTTAFDAAGAAATALTSAEAYTDAAVDGLGSGTGTVTSVNTVEPVGGDVTLTPADIGAATAAQGALADSATQPGDLGTAATTDATDYATAAQGGKADTAVQPTRTVAGHALSADVTISASDVGAVPTTRTVNSKALSADITLSASDVSAVPTTRTVNSKALSADITLSASDVSAVPTTRTVAGHALSADVTVSKSDVGLGSVDNTADTAKPVSTAQQTALDLKANLASPTLTGTPAAPTATAGTNTTQLATTAFVKAALDKQAEYLTIALGDESTAITTGTKVTLRSPFAITLTTIPRASLTGSSSSGNPAFNIKKNGTSVFSTTLTIDSGEKTSVTAATAAVLSTTAIADDDELTFIVDTAGTGATGAKITLYFTRA